ncbi:unnamed protein product [Lathyrus sativus]|nr:unnamed protein product [Lathyrus sativus]
MADREDRLRLGRVSQHAFVRQEQSQATVTEADIVEAYLSSSHAQDIPSTSYHTPSHPLFHPRGVEIQLKVHHRPRWDTFDSPPDVDMVPPLEDDDPPSEDVDDDDNNEPEGIPGGPSYMSMLTGYADHTARHVWDEETRQTQKFYNHGQKILSLEQPHEAWF